jgi:hypothetical protein
VQHAFPVVEVLRAQRRVEAVGMARGCNVGGRRAFAEHLLDGVSGDEVNQQEDKTDYQPNDWECVEDALEEEFQISG